MVVITYKQYEDIYLLDINDYFTLKVRFSHNKL